MNATVSVAAIAAASAVAKPSFATPENPLDGALQDLWIERHRTVAEYRTAWAAYDAACARMPEWAQEGPCYLQSDGSYTGPIVGWPRIEGGQKPKGAMMINKRPNLSELRADFSQRLTVCARRDRDAVSKAYQSAVADFKERCERQVLEETKAGVTESELAVNSTSDRIGQINKKIESSLVVSPTKAAVMFMLGMTYGGHQDDTLEMDEMCAFARGILPLIRPQLSGLIAQQVDDLIEHPEKPHGERDFW